MKNISKKWSKDSTGQWWYVFGKKKPTRTRGEVRKCERCGGDFLHPHFQSRANKKRGKFCSRDCASKQLGGHRNKRGAQSHCWRGGKHVVRGGYIEVYAPEHPLARGKKYVREHRLVMEKHLGRYLQPYEQVHHRNGVKNDNRLENLELISGRVHLGEVTCPHCTKPFFIK